MATPIQRAEQANYLIAKIGSESTANVWLSVPRAIADAILGAPGSLKSENDKLQVYGKLRGVLQATKVAVQFADDQMYDLSDEVVVLQDLSDRKLENAATAKILKFDRSSADKVWFTTELLKGRTLEQFLAANLELTDDLAWHCIRQITGTILAVYFSRSQPQYYQGDVRSANLMFRLPAQGCPSLILIDFGQAKKIEGEHDAAFFDRQREDVRECFKILAASSANTIIKQSAINDGNMAKERSVSGELRALAAESERIFVSEQGQDGNAHLEKMVNDAYDLALTRMEMAKCDLSDKLVEYFGAALKTEDGRLVTMEDLLSCRTSKGQPDDEEESDVAD